MKLTIDRAKYYVRRLCSRGRCCAMGAYLLALGVPPDEMEDSASGNNLSAASFDLLPFWVKTDIGWGSSSLAGDVARIMKASDYKRETEVVEHFAAHHVEVVYVGTYPAPSGPYA